MFEKMVGLDRELKLLFLAEICHGLVTIGPFFPLFIKKLGGGTFEIGTIYLISFFFALLFQIPIGKLSDKYGRKWFLIFGYVILLLVPLMYSIIEEMYPLPFIAALGGIGASMVTPTTYAFITDYSSSEERGFAYGLFQTIIGVSGFSGPILAAYLVQNGGFDLLFYVVSITTCIGLIFLFCLREKPVKITEETEKNYGILDALKIIALRRNLRFFFFVAFLGSIFSSFWIAFLPLYAVDVIGISTLNLGILYSAIEIAKTMGTFFGGFIADRYDKKNTLVFSEFIMATVFMLALATNFYHLLIISFYLNLLKGVGGPAGSAIISESMPSELRGTIWGYFLSFMQIGGFISPLLIAYLWLSFGIFPFFILYACISVISAFIIFEGVTLPKREIDIKSPR